MTQSAHISNLQGIAHDYAATIMTRLRDDLERDGFGANVPDAITLTGMTVQTIMTLHLLTLSDINPQLARSCRDIFAAQIEASRNWL